MNTSLDPTPKRPADDVLRAYSPRPIVRRLNRTALFLVLAVIALLFAGRMIVGLIERRAAQIAEDEQDKAHLRASTDMADRGVIGKLPSDYTFFMQPPPAPPKPEPPKPIEEPKEPAPDPEMLKQLEHLRQEWQAGIDSPIQFPNAHPLSPIYGETEPPTPDDRVGAASNSYGASTTREQTYDARQREFFRDATNVQTYVRSRIQPPRSLYEVKAGKVIPAALVTPINTDLPGEVVGQVTANLYDSMSGKYLLIPQGSQLIGRYDSEVHKGQDRALIAWQRLILPNGYSIVLEAMPGTDAQGVAGMSDQVDWHAKRLAGATLLSTLISLGGNYAANIKPEKKELAIVGETVSQDSARVGARVIDRELDLRPTITVRAGTTFNVLVNKDLEMTPYIPVITRH